MPTLRDEIRFIARGSVDDDELNRLHAAAFGPPLTSTPWSARLARYSLTWIVARRGDELVGFVNVVGDGGVHAILLDTCVRPRHQHLGIGRALVAEAAREARRLGCEWLHVDFEPHLEQFYLGACGMRTTAAGLLRL